MRQRFQYPEGMAPDLKQLLPLDKCDVRNAEALVSHGYPAIGPVLPQILDWIQDGNWPVARVFSPLLASVGAALAPHARSVLNGNDDAWKYFLIQDVVAKSSELAMALRPELERLAFRATALETAEGVNVVAKHILNP
jgi:hypothetical protein